MRCGSGLALPPDQNMNEMNGLTRRFAIAPMMDGTLRAGK
jgi:hypothetical protein